MTPSELGQQIKQKFPGTYDQYPDEVVGQRTLVKYPQYQQMMDKGIGGTVKEMFTRPASAVADLGTNPETMANAMPAALGTAGAVAMPFGGGTIGTGAGEAIRDTALHALGKPIPSLGQHAKELALGAAGDVASGVGQLAKYGSDIGKAESLAGVPSAMDIESTPMNLGQKSIGEYINDAVRSVKDSGGKGAPEYWLQMKDQLDRIYKLGKDAGLTGLDTRRLAELKNIVQDGLNAAVPGRGVPSAGYARTMTMPNAYKAGWKAIPTPVKVLAGVGGATSAGVAVSDLLKKTLMGGNR